ncbi:PaaI family thioesterase [Phenylobacterium sp.]|uniref:PaaI family thioesterase n=1 Tax=Phenylobacterium sp. TaxID=1871053 RepID=UPI0035B2A505
MTASPDILRRSASLSAAPAAPAALLEPALAEVSGPGAEPVSLTLDYAGAARAGVSVVVEAWVDRATRTLVFAHGRLLAAEDGALVATGSAVFRRPGAAPAAP